MQGSLTQIQLPEILQFLSMGKGSGLLTLSRGGNDIVLMVRSGRIINSSAITRMRRLGELLVQRGILRRSTLAEVLKLQRTIEADKPLGAILIERDIVSEATIREVLRMQLEEEIWNLFSWEEGDFKFEALEDSKLGEALVQIDIEPLILEGTRRHDEWKKIQKVIPDDSVVLVVNRVGDDFKRDIKLSPAEWRVLAQVNGRCNVRAIMNRSAMGRFEVFQILNNFLKRGIVAVSKNTGAPPQPINDMQTIVEDMPKKPAGSGSGGFGGLRSLFGGGQKERSGDRIEFPTPIGALAGFISELAEDFLGAKELKADPSDHSVLERLWKDISSVYTRADLVVVDHTRVRPDRFETYLRLFEFSPATQDSYEDTMEALFALLDGVYRHFAGRLGERAAAKIVRDALAGFTPRISLRYRPDFNLQEQVQSFLRLAA
jgi:hypothetical protein